MKYSIFNTYLQLNNRIGVIYNSMLDKAIFSPNIYLSNIKSTPIESIDDKTLRTAFVEDGTDEYNLYLSEMLAYENDNKSFHLIINPTLDCIFSCWYCYEHHTKGCMTKVIIDQIFKLINKLSTEYDALTISFFGGEPLMYYDSVLIPIVQYASSIFKSVNKEFNFNMTTNGFLLNLDRIVLMKKYSFSGAQITLDGDKETHDKTRLLAGGLSTYDRIIDNIRHLANQGCYVTVRLNCTHENIDSYYSLSEAFADLMQDVRYNIIIDCHIVWQEKDKDILQEKQHGLVAYFANKQLKASKMDFKQFCYADRRAQCVVNYNGDVYKCTAVDFNKTPRDGYINEDGNIIWENNSLELRMQSKQRNTRCKSCSVLPLCHGGCSSRSLESSDYCLYPTSHQKEQLVINRLEHIISLQNDN